MKTHLIPILLIITLLLSCEKDDGINQDSIKSDYSISVNEQFTINLVSNPTTGYSWQWANEQTISNVDTTDWSYIADNNLIGSGGIEMWKFKGTKSGIDSIKMNYCRSWEPDSIIDSKIIVVKVK